MPVELLQYSCFSLIKYTFEEILAAQEIWHTSEGMVYSLSSFIIKFLAQNLIDEIKSFRLCSSYIMVIYTKIISTNEML